MTETYRNETGKHFYVTPLSYMKMLKTFMKAYIEKKEEKEHQRDTYINGVKMLDECGIIVQNMS
jgi:dynein heavy chain